MSNGNWIPDAVWENIPYGGIAGGIWVGGTEVLAVVVGNPDAAVVTIEPIDPSVTAPAVINFIATASGSGNLSYQWELDAVPIVDATLSTYDRTTQATDGGKEITCTIIDGLGETATSLPSTMTVALPPLPTVTIEPIDPAVFETEVIPFVATTTGTGVVVNTPSGAAAITLQWNLDGVPISGQQSSTYDRTTVLADNTKVITCTVTDTAGQVVESLPSTMTVTTPPPPVVTTQPVGATIVEATTHVLSVVVDGFAPISYQWQQSVDGVSFSAISGATAASYTYTGILNDPAGLIFRCNILDGIGQGVASASATMVVTQAEVLVFDLAAWMLQFPTGLPAGFTKNHPGVLQRAGNAVNSHSGGFITGINIIYRTSIGAPDHLVPFDLTKPFRYEMTMSAAGGESPRQTRCPTSNPAYGPINLSVNVTHVSPWLTTTSTTLVEFWMQITAASGSNSITMSGFKIYQ